MEHVGTEHNKVLRFVSHFQGKNVKMVFNTKLEGFKLIQTGALDPLAQDPLADSEVDLAANKQEVGSNKSKSVRDIAITNKTRAARRPIDNNVGTVVSSESLWVGRLRKFADQQEGSLQMMLDGDFQDVASKVVGRFLETLASETEVEEAVVGLSKFCPGLKDSQAVARAKLVRIFKAHCESIAVPPSSLPAMQTVILLSQLLGKPGANPGDLRHVLEAVGRLDAAHEEPLVVEFFKSVGHPLLREEREDNQMISGSKQEERLKDEGKKSLDKGKEIVVPLKLFPVKEEGTGKSGISMPFISMNRVRIHPDSPKVSSKQGPTVANSQLPLEENLAIPDNQATELVEVKSEPILVAMERRQDTRTGLDPECITLDEEEGEKEEKDYRFLCLDCEGERGCNGPSCMHTTHPRYQEGTMTNGNF